jgi:hypothetical protein
MSVDPSSGPPYRPPAPDSVLDRPVPLDPGFGAPATRPGEEEAGPLYTTPEADRWIATNVTDRGYVIDWGTREIIDPATGESHGTIPQKFDRMI